MSIKDLLVENHQISKRNGFHDPLDPEVSARMTGLLLIYSEVLEALEPEANVPEELADVVLRCSDHLQRWSDASDMHNNLDDMEFSDPRTGSIEYLRGVCDVYVTMAIRAIRNGGDESGSVEQIGWHAAATLYALGYDVSDELARKVANNRTRGHMHGGKRA